MASVVSHSVILITSLSRVILIHYEWHLDMPSLTNVDLPYAFHYKKDVTIRGSTLFISLSRIDIGALQRFFNWSPRGGWILFVPHISFITVWEPIISVQVLTQWPFQSQVKSIIQNRWNSRSSSFSKTIWNRYISHSIITCIPFCHNRKRYVFSPFTLISVSMLVWITSQMAFKRDCGYNQFRWISWLLQFCHRSSLIRYWVSFKHVNSISSRISGSFSLARSRSDELIVIAMERDCIFIFPSSWVVVVCILVVGDNSTSSMKK